MGLHERRKWDALVGLRPDVAVVPEAPSPGNAAMGKLLDAATSSAWIGPNESRGLGLVSFGAYAMSPLPRRHDERPDTLAAHVSGDGAAFVLIGVWTRAPGYVQHLHDVLDEYEPLLRDHEVVLAGDFNSSALWDDFHGERCHTALVRRLSALGLESAYHWTRREPHGGETESTAESGEKDRRRYHVDYAFVPRPWLPRLRCQLGAVAEWHGLSDHVPLTIDVDP